MTPELVQKMMEEFRLELQLEKQMALPKISKLEFTIIGHQQTSAWEQLDQILCLNNIVEPKVLGH